MILTIIAAALLLALIAMLAVGNYQLLSDLRVKRNKKLSVADLLNYAAMVDDGIIINKDGSLMAAWLYRGIDVASSTEKQQEMLALRLNQAFAKLDNGWMVHVDAVRMATPNYSAVNQSHFTDKVSQAIDDERRQLFGGLDTLYDGFFVITVTWLPPSFIKRRFVELMFSDNDRDHDDSKYLLNNFRRECANLESRLSAAVTLQRLCNNGSHNELLSWLQFCITGINHPITLPKNSIYLDALLGGQELWTGVIPKLGEHFIQTVAIEGFPLESYPNILAALTEFPINYRWSSRFIFMDHHEAVAHLATFRKKWQQKIRGFFDQLMNNHNGRVDADAASMVADADAAIAETNSGMVAQGYYTSVVVLMHEDRAQLTDNARRFAKLINAHGFAARVETLNTMDAYLGSLPGHSIENIRRPLINTLNFADLLPTSTIWTGEDKAPCPKYPSDAPPLMHCVTSGDAPFRLNLHVGDLGHTIMFGPSRAGKSTHLAMLALQFRRYANARVFAFDKGMSMYPTCKAVNGSHYELAAEDKKLNFAPLAMLATADERTWALNWLENLLALNGITVTPIQSNAMADALLSMHKSGSTSLSDFTITLQDDGIRQALQRYTVDGLMGHLLDADTDNLALSDFTTFEIGELLKLGDQYVLPVLSYLFRRIERALDGRPTLIILDEAWVMLQHPTFCAVIRTWLRTVAKANCCVVMATQHLSDATNSAIFDVINEDTATKIFLPNISAHDTAATYQRMGLNERQIDIIAQAVPTRDYYYVSRNGARLYSLALGPLALAFVGHTDLNSLKTIKDLSANDDWVTQWLATKGLKL